MLCQTHSSDKHELASLWMENSPSLMKILCKHGTQNWDGEIGDDRTHIIRMQYTRDIFVSGAKSGLVRSLYHHQSATSVASFCTHLFMFWLHQRLFLFASSSNLMIKARPELHIFGGLKDTYILIRYSNVSFPPETSHSIMVSWAMSGPSEPSPVWNARSASS